MSEVTTVKVSKPVRQRISAAAAKRDLAVPSFLEQLMDEHDRRERMAAVAAALRNADAETLNDWRLESADWAVADTDGEVSQ